MNHPGFSHLPRDSNEKTKTFGSFLSFSVCHSNAVPRRSTRLLRSFMQPFRVSVDTTVKHNRGGVSKPVYFLSEPTPFNIVPTSVPENDPTPSASSGCPSLCQTCQSLSPLENIGRWKDKLNKPLHHDFNRPTTDFELAHSCKSPVVQLDLSLVLSQSHC